MKPVVVCIYRELCENPECPHYYSHVEIDNCTAEEDCLEIRRTVYCISNKFEQDEDVKEEAQVILKEARTVASLLV